MEVNASAGAHMPAAQSVERRLKDHVDQLVNTATTKADQAWSALMQSLDGRSHFDMLYRLIKEEEWVENQAENDPHPYYVEHFLNDGELLNHFVNRMLLLQVSESEELMQSVYLGKYRHHVIRKILELREQIPEYSQEKFMQGIDCPYLLTFEKYHNVAKGDYYKIREWQSQAIIEVIVHDYQLLIKRLQKACSIHQDPLPFLHAELKKIRDSQMSMGVESHIKQRLSQLNCLQAPEVDELDQELLLQHLEYFLSEKLELLGLRHSDLQNMLDRMTIKPGKLAGSELTIFFVLRKLTGWLEHVIQNGIWKQNVEEPDYLAHLEQAKALADAELEERTMEIEEYAYDETKDRLEVKEYLLERFDKYRKVFNAFDEKYFFYFLEEKKSQLLQRLFVNNCFFSGDLEGQKKVLQEALFLHNILWTIVQVHNDIFDTHIMEDTVKEDDNTMDVIDMASALVMNKELFRKIHLTLHDTIHQFHDYFLPFEVHRGNNREAFRNIFEDAMQRLQEILDAAPTSNKIMYLQSRLKDIRRNELATKMFERKHHMEVRKSGYGDLFKELLQLENEYMKETKNLLLDLPIPEMQFINNKDYRSEFTGDALTAKKNAFVSKMLEDIGISINGKCALSERKKGAIRGVVIALRNGGILPNKTLDSLCNFIAAKISLRLNSRLAASTISDEMQRTAEKYIKEHWSAG